MQELLGGLLGAAIGIALWLDGYHHGRPKTKKAEKAAVSPTQQAALTQALREQYNFWNFEGDEMREK